MYTLKKSLGQHFLKDENICRKIIASLEERPFSKLLEVGPGGGALRKYLVKLDGVDFKAVELDDEKVEYLLKTYPALTAKIIHQSFLDIDKPFNEPFTVSLMLVFRKRIRRTPRLVFFTNRIVAARSPCRHTKARHRRLRAEQI